MKGKNIVLNGIVSIIMQIAMILCGFIIPRLIIESYGSEVNGLIISINQFLGYITLLEAGFGTVIKSVLYKPITEHDSKKIEGILKCSDTFFKKLSFIFLGYIAVLIMIYPIIVNLKFDYIYTASLLFIIGVSTFAEYYFGMTYKLFLQADKKNYIPTSISFFTYIINALVTIILIKLNFGIHIVKLISCIIFLFRPLIQFLYVKKRYNFNINKDTQMVNITQKWDGFSQHIAYVIHSSIDVVLLTFFCDISEVSVYSIYLLVLNGINSIIQASTSGVSAVFGEIIAKEDYEVLKKDFKMYELIYYSIIVVIYTCTLILIIPFIRLYTFGISDVNYIRPVFAILFVLSGFIYEIRGPYNLIVLVAGHFKETKIRCVG